MRKSFTCAMLSVGFLASALTLTACSATLDDRESVFSYVEKNVDGLNSFCESVKDTSPYFESITHTNNHPISENDAAEIVEGMYAVGLINNSRFYEEVNYDFVEEPLSEGIFDSITMYVDYTVSYSFSCFAEKGSDVGFYYTDSDKPLYCGKEYDFKESDSGYKYELPNEREYYTEKICDNWYYYQVQ